MTVDELDRLAAEKVMGWEPIDCDDYTCYQTPNGDRFIGLTNRTEPNKWQPTRNIAQAWECLEQVGVFTLALKTYHDGSEYAYHVIIPGNITETSTSAPEAIVRACLRARGIDIPTGDRGVGRVEV